MVLSSAMRSAARGEREFNVALKRSWTMPEPI